MRQNIVFIVLAMRTTDVADKYCILLLYKLALLQNKDLLLISGDIDLKNTVNGLNDSGLTNIMVAKPKMNSSKELQGKPTMEWDILKSGN